MQSARAGTSYAGDRRDLRQPRDGRRQARLARLLGSALIEIEPLDDERARAAGQLCGVRGSTDVIDASVALCARARDHGVLTSDPDDLAHLDPGLRIVPV